MALYPEVSPTAPISRDDLAAILAAQGLAGGQQPGDASSVDMAALGATAFGGRGDFQGAPPANSNPDDPGSTPAASFDPGGPMTTANASMINDPDTTGYTNAPAFGRTGDDSSDPSQAAQAAGRDAMAAAAAGRAPAGDPLGDATQAFGSFNSGANMFGNVGAMTPGAVLGSGHAQTQSGMPGYSNPSAFAASAYGSPFAGRGGPDREGFGSVIAEGPGAPGWDTGDTGNHAIADMLADALADPGWGGGSGARSGGGAVTTGGGGARSGGGAPGGFNEGAANQGIADMMGAALADPGWGGGANAPGSGGYGPDFGGTGGYSGSGDVGNTSGAGGGAVGGFGGGVGGGDGAGAGSGAGAGAGTGSGNDSGSDGASGGVG